MSQQSTASTHSVFITHIGSRKLYSISEEIKKAISDHLTVCHPASVHTQNGTNIPSSVCSCIHVWSGQRFLMCPDLWIVSWLFYDLGCHPEWRAHKRVPLDLSVRKLACHTKVRQFHITLLWQQHISSCGGTYTDTLVFVVYFHVRSNHAVLFQDGILTLYNIILTWVRYL